MSADSLWGPGAVALQRGAFSADEMDYARAAHEVLGAVADEAAVPQALRGAPVWDLGAAALRACQNYFTAPANAAAIDARLRWLGCYTDQGVAAGCQALAFAAPQPLRAQPTYLVHANVHGLALLLERAAMVVEALGAPLAVSLPGAAAGRAAQNCGFIAMLLMWLHELGHVLRGHLDWQPPVSGSCADLDAAGRNLRRVFETDADAFAATLLGDFLRGYAARDGDGSDAAAWFVCGLAGSYALYATLAEGGARDDCYHTPIVRLNACAAHLARRCGLTREAGSAGFAAFLAALTRSAERRRTLLQALEFNAATYNQDDAALRGVTMPALRELVQQGRLKAWTT